MSENRLTDDVLGRRRALPRKGLLIPAHCLGVPVSVVGFSYDSGVRFRLLCAGSMLMLLAACGSGDGSGARPTLPSDASIVRPTSPPEGAGIPPVETQPSEPEQIAPPEATAPPEEQPEATAAPGTAPVSGAAPVDDDGGAVWWPWILLAVVLVVVAAVAMARGRRRSPSWQVRSTTLLDEIEQLTSHLAVVTPAGLHAVAQSDAMKLATLRATLRELVASAPDAAVARH